MKTIVAIGGGDLRTGGTRSIDETIVRLSGKEHPHLLFLPTASSDAPGYINSVREVFTQLGCVVDDLCLVSGQLTTEQIRVKVEAADIVYVGGGDTVRMIQRWKETGVDRLLQNAWERGTVLSGLSAGAICWCVYGHSDSESFVAEEGAQWNFCKAPGLSYLPIAICPHYDEPGRSSFDEMMEGETLPGLALENNTALLWQDGMCQILKSSPDAHAYLLHWTEAGLDKKELQADAEFQF